ncbi:TPA: glycosyltransferase, partial [Escherichia coli]|nr:glycosyltransferase [Escherichia coli]
ILSSNIENAEVEIFSLQKKHANPFYFLSNKISVKYGNGWRYYSLLSYLIFCKKNKHKVIVESMGRLSLECGILAKAIRLHDIYFHEHVGLNSFKKAIQLIKIFSYYIAKKVIVLTSHDYNLLTTKYGIKNVIQIPNINPFDTSNNIIKPYDQRENIVIAVGRFTEQKNFNELIEIWHEANIPNWTLYIIGDGPNKRILEKAIAGMSSIKMFKTTDEICNYYNAAKIYAMTSLYEGLPMVLIESQSFGIPSVAYDCPTGPAEIITDNVNGFLIPFKNRELFIQKLRKLTSDDNLSNIFSTNAIKNSRKYNADAIIHKW